MEMRKLFSKIQLTHMHKKQVDRLVQIEKKWDSNMFFEEFTRNVTLILINEPKSPYTKDGLEFVVNYLTICSRGKSENVPPQDTAIVLFERFIHEVIVNLLKHSNRIECRINCCNLIAKLFSKIEDIDEGIYNEVKEALVERAADKNMAVRCQAAMALEQFQELNDDDSAISALKFHVKYDPQNEVRQACLEVLLPCKDTICVFVNATRDINDVNRKISLNRIADSISIERFSMEQRMTILKNGLNDPSAPVRKTAETKLLSSWLKSCNNDIIELLQLLDIQSHQSLIEKMTNICFNQLFSVKVSQYKTKFHEFVEHFIQTYLDHKKLILKKPLCIENVIVWRLIAEFSKKNNCVVKIDREMTINNESNEFVETQDLFVGPEEIDLFDFVIPDLPDFCKYMKTFIEKVSNKEFPESDLKEFEFICEELIKMCLLIDIADDVQKKILIDTMKKFLVMNVGDENFNNYMRPIMKCIAYNALKDGESLLDFMEIIIEQVQNHQCEQDDSIMNIADQSLDDEIRKENFNYGKHVVELNELRDQLDQLVAQEKYREAQDIKEEIDKVKEKMKDINEKRFQLQNQSMQSVQSKQSEPPNLEDDHNLFLRCLYIFCGCLEYGKFKVINAVMQSYMEKLILPGILKDHVKIREISIRCLGLICFISKQHAAQYLPMLLEILHMDCEAIQIIALQSIFDSFCQHGLCIIDKNAIEKFKKSLDKLANERENTNEQASTSNSEVNQEDETRDQNDKDKDDPLKLLNDLLEDQLDSSSNAIKQLTAQGFTKLFILGKINKKDKENKKKRKKKNQKGREPEA